MAIKPIPLLAMVATVLVCTPALAKTSATLTASVQSDEVGLNDTFTLTLTLKVDGHSSVEDLKLPDTGGLQVLSTSRSEGSSVQIGGGYTVMKRTVTIQMILVGRKPGRERIGSATARIDGEVIKSEPLAVTVLPQGMRTKPPAQAQKPFNPFNPFDDAEPPQQSTPEDNANVPRAHGLMATPAMLRAGLFATLEAEPERAVLGQQITLTVRLYSRLDISSIDGMRLPKLDGFWTEEVESARRITPTPVIIEGQRFNSYLVRRVALFPTRAGEFELPAVQLDVLSGGSFFSAGERRSAFSMPLKITVEPLPAEGQPPHFQSGNVGQFTLEARLDKPQVSRSQPATLIITVRGTGNLRHLAVPTLQPNADVRVFDPTPSEEIVVRDGKFTGHKTLEYLLQPKRAGRIALPPVQLDYFDPVRHKYMTQRVDQLVLDVVEDDAAAQGQGSTPRGNVLAVQARPVRINVSPGGGLRPLRSHPQLPVMLGMPLLMALGTLSVGGFLRRRKERRSADRSVAAKQATRSLLDAAKQGLGPEAVSGALEAYLGARLGGAVTGLTRAELKERLSKRKVGKEEWERLSVLLERLDEARYAPSGASRTAALADEVVAVVRSLEKWLAEDA